MRNDAEVDRPCVSGRRCAAFATALAGLMGAAACGGQHEGDGSSREWAAVRLAGTGGAGGAGGASSVIAHPEYDLDLPISVISRGAQLPSDIDPIVGGGSYRLVSISAVLPATSPPRFNAVYVANQGAYRKDGNGWQYDLTQTQLNAKAGDQRIRIVDIAAYRTAAGAVLYAAAWITNDGVKSAVLSDLSPSLFIANVAPASGQQWRVIDVETLADAGSTTTYKVSGVGVDNNDAMLKPVRKQYFGYGPVAGGIPTPAMAVSPQNISVGTGVSFNKARIADLATPFGDGNFFWVSEDTLDQTPPPDSLPDRSCTVVDDHSSERNWWFTDLRAETNTDSPASGHEDFLAHAVARYGGRVGKLKSYVSTTAGVGTRYVGVIYDNGSPTPTGTDPGSNTVLQKIDAAFLNRLKRWGLPGGALALAKDGQLVYARGYGNSSLGDGTSMNLARRAQPDDMFRLASVSKPLASALLLRLLSEDRAKLKPQYQASVSGPGVTLDSYPFGIFPYTPPAGVTGGCDVDSTAATPDFSGCTLRNIKIRHLIRHQTGLVAANPPGVTYDRTALFSADAVPPSGPGANRHDTWIAKEKYFHCQDTTPPAPICVRKAFFAAPGTAAASQYMNTHYQIIADLIFELTGLSYSDYLAEVLGKIQVNRIKRAHAVATPDATGLFQAVPYSEPMPFCYNTPTNNNNYKIPSTPWADILVDDTLPAIYTSTFVGSGAMAAAPVDLVRWATAIEGSRGGVRLLNNDMFVNEFRTPGVTTATYPYDHGGVLNFDAQAHLALKGIMPAGGTSKYTYAFAANGDSLLCGTQDPQDLCCQGTTNCVVPPATGLTCGTGIAQVPVFRWTHAQPTRGSSSLGDFDVELRDDLDSILNNCGSQIPLNDHFSEYFPGEPHAVCKPAALSPGATSCQVTLTPSQVDGGSTGATLLALSKTTFALGTAKVTLSASNAIGTSTCIADVTVRDGVAPAITPPDPIEVTVCDKVSINVKSPTVSDGCGISWLKGEVISTNGVALLPPRLVPDDRIMLLGPGLHTIRWTVSDGTLTSTANSTVKVHATIQAAGSFIVEDNAQVKQATGWAGVFNSGSGATMINAGAKTGNIISTGFVALTSGATVNGSILSGGSVSVPSGATVTGTQTSLPGQVVLGPLPTLPTFPATTGSDLTIPSGTTTPLTPASRPAVTVKNGGTLVLSAGDYYFRSLTIESGASVRAVTGTKVYVKDQLALNAPVRDSGGSALQPIFLGFAASTSLSIPVRFDGTLVAPNASVIMSNPVKAAFTGAFYAGSIDLMPGNIISCVTGNAVLAF